MKFIHYISLHLNLIFFTLTPKYQKALQIWFQNHLMVSLPKLSNIIGTCFKASILLSTCFHPILLISANASTLPQICLFRIAFALTILWEKPLTMPSTSQPASSSWTPFQEPGCAAYQLNHLSHILDRLGFVGFRCLGLICLNQLTTISTRRIVLYMAQCRYTCWCTSWLFSDLHNYQSAI